MSEKDLFIVWLETVQCTKPFTCADAKELHTIIHNSIPASVPAKVDVYTTKGDVVHVRVELDQRVVERELPIV